MEDGDDGEGESGLIHALFKEAHLSAGATCKRVSTHDDLRELELAEVSLIIKPFYSCGSTISKQTHLL